MEHRHVERETSASEGGDGWDQTFNKDRKGLYPKKKPRCGSGQSEITSDGKGKCRPSHRPHGSNLVRAGRTRGPVDPSVKKVMLVISPGIGHRIVANKRIGPYFGLTASHKPRVMTTTRPLVEHTVTHTRRDNYLASIQMPSIPWNCDGPLLLQCNIRNSNPTSDPNSRLHRRRLSIIAEARSN